MKLNTPFFLSLLFLFILSNNAFAVVAVKGNKSVEGKELHKKTRSQKEVKKEKKWQKRVTKIKDKVAKKIAKWKSKKKVSSNYSSDSRFRLGLILLGGGLVLAIIARAAGLGFIHWIAGLAALIGVILLILVLLEV